MVLFLKKKKKNWWNLSVVLSIVYWSQSKKKLASYKHLTASFPLEYKLFEDAQQSLIFYLEDCWNFSALILGYQRALDYRSYIMIYIMLQIKKATKQLSGNSCGADGVLILDPVCVFGVREQI